MKTIKKMKNYSKVLLCSALIMFVVAACGFIWRPKHVTIVADGNKQIVETNDVFLASIVKEHGVELGKYDTIKINTKYLEDGSVITVLRAIPVEVVVNGKMERIMTTEPTADDLAKSLKYSKPKYVALGDMNKKLKKDDKIEIAKITNTVKATEDIKIPVQIVQEPDPTMPKGLSHLVEQGHEGLASVNVEKYYQGDKLVQTEVLKKEVKEKMKPSIVKVGTRNSMIAASRGVMRYSKKMTLEATAYTVAEGNGDGLTATGLVAVPGIVAVDPTVIKLGTRLYIPGYGVALAADVGGAIQGNRIDLLMDDYNDAIQFGRRPIDVYILE